MLLGHAAPSMDHIPRFLGELARDPAAKGRMQPALRFAQEICIAQPVADSGGDAMRPKAPHAIRSDTKALHRPLRVVGEQHHVVATGQQRASEIEGVEAALDDYRDLHCSTPLAWASMVCNRCRYVWPPSTTRRYAFSARLWRSSGRWSSQRTFSTISGIESKYRTAFPSGPNSSR